MTAAVAATWWEIGEHPGQLAMPSASAVSTEAASMLAAELQQRVICLAAGDELYAGEWLTGFQRADGAWDVCVEALKPGPLPTCDKELLQEFCAQTLARLGRGFVSHHQPAAQRQQRDILAALLKLHSADKRRPEVWKQLALALTCADLWLGTWAPPLPAAADVSPEGGGSLPWTVRRELLALPVELLFCDRALPLDDARLRQAAAGSLLDACGTAFAELMDVTEQGEDAEKESQSALRALAQWLGALRKALCLQPVRDAAGPLRMLAAQGERLLALAKAAPAQAFEVVQQLARWQQCGCGQELATLLGPLLEFTIGAASSSDFQAVLPLLSDLAAGVWPRAVLGNFALDWQSVAVQAVAAIRTAVECGGDNYDGTEDADAADAEAALAIWQTFAKTVKEGTRGSADWPDEESAGPRPEKRTRLSANEEIWRASPEEIAQCEALPQLFGLFARELLQVLRIQTDPDDAEGLLGLRDVRIAALEALTAWAELVGDSSAWQEATWAPLHQIGTHLTSSVGTEMPEEVWREAEAVLWFSATLAASWPGAKAGGAEATTPPPAAAVLELGGILDSAPESWRALLWSAACSLAATAPAEYSAGMVEWVLARPPMAAGTTELRQFVELPYAEALSTLCRNFQSTGACDTAVGERLAAMAFEERPVHALHEDSVKAQRCLLQAMRHAMGSETGLLCQGLSQTIVPALCKAVESEAAGAIGDEDPSWRAAQALFATLAAMLPEAPASFDDMSHPSVTIWKQSWPFFEAALVTWPASATDQPLAAAAESLTAASKAVPGLLPGALQLLARSAASRELPQVQLDAIRDITASAPLDTCRLSDLLGANVLTTVDALLGQQKMLLSGPSTVAALYRLLADERVRALLFQHSELAGRCVVMAAQALPELTSADASAAILAFIAGLIGSNEEFSAETGRRSMVVAALPEVCKAICIALTSHEHLAELDDGLTNAVEFFARCAEVMPAELQAALSAGLAQAQVREWSAARFLRLVTGRAEFARKGEWLDQLQQMVCELQRERRRATIF